MVARTTSKKATHEAIRIDFQIFRHISSDLDDPVALSIPNPQDIFLLQSRATGKDLFDNLFPFFSDELSVYASERELDLDSWIRKERRIWREESSVKGDVEREGSERNSGGGGRGLGEREETVRGC